MEFRSMRVLEFPTEIGIDGKRSKKKKDPRTDEVCVSKTGNFSEIKSIGGFLLFYFIPDRVQLCERKIIHLFAG